MTDDMEVKIRVKGVKSIVMLLRIELFKNNIEILNNFENMYN